MYFCGTPTTFYKTIQQQQQQKFFISQKRFYILLENMYGSRMVSWQLQFQIDYIFWWNTQNMARLSTF